MEEAKEEEQQHSIAETPLDVSTSSPFAPPFGAPPPFGGPPFDDDGLVPTNDTEHCKTMYERCTDQCAMMRMGVHQDTCKEEAERQNDGFILTESHCICEPSKDSAGPQASGTAWTSNPMVAQADNGNTAKNTLNIGDMIRSADLGVSAEAKSTKSEETKTKGHSK